MKQVGKAGFDGISGSVVLGDDGDRRGLFTVMRISSPNYHGLCVR